MLHLLEHIIAHATRHLGDRAEPVSENARGKAWSSSESVHWVPRRSKKAYDAWYVVIIEGEGSDLETVKHLIRVISFHGISGIRPLEGSKLLVGHVVCVSKYKSVYT